jgi:hypothetical protein
VNLTLYSRGGEEKIIDVWGRQSFAEAVAVHGGRGLSGLGGSGHQVDRPLLEPET